MDTSVACPHCRHELRLVSASAKPLKISGETVDAWVRRWYGARKVARPGEERRTYELWIRKHLGKRPIAAVSRDDIEAWVETMDRHVAAGRLSWSTARRIWSLLTSMFRDASSSKVRALRVRHDNPCAGVRPPDRNTEKASTFLYPSEFLCLMRCRRIPLLVRRIYAAEVYLYPRAGELRALEWADIDVRSGHSHVHRSEDRKAVVGSTKTGADRQFIAERRLLPLLRVMRREARGEGRVFPRIPQRNNLARMLRQHLRWAGCDRADLYARDATRRPLTFHDLRATGITWMAMRGDSPADIKERVGHTQLSTTERYLRRGRLLARAQGERPFPPLPECLLKKSTGRRRIPPDRG